MRRRFIALAVAASLLAACTVAPRQPPPEGAGRYSQRHDGAPLRMPRPEEMADAQPRPDPILPAGNKTPYQVGGREYRLIDNYRGFRQRGVASWYGTKFHGHQTSNGEVYDLYAMSAAHKTLPIPLYVRVTNLDNGRQAVVRVNDRGPFHSDRIIDLSYAAAVKLGYADRGTAPVEIEVIDTDNIAQPTAAPRYYLQVAAFQQLSSAQRLESSLRAGMNFPVGIAQAGANPELYRVRVGPLADFPSVQAARRNLALHWQGEPHLLVDNDRDGENF